MRRIIATVLSILLMLSLAACQPSNTSLQTTPPSSNPTTIPEGNTDAPLRTFYALSVPGQVEYLYNDEGILLFEYAYQHIQMHIADPNVADKITLDFLNRVDSTRESVDDIAQQAKDNYDGGTNWSAYKYHVYYSPTRVDQGIISLFGTKSSYTGGLHPDQGGMSVTYDAASGECLTLGSILKHVDNKEDVCNLVLDHLEDLDYQYSLFDGYESIVKDRFNVDESIDEAFYFTNTGLSFYFAPYELAPFSTGIITVEIPYSELSGILNDAYFPDEYQPSTGKLIAENAEETDTGEFDQLMEVVLHPHGKQVLLYSDKTVRNLTITRGSWTPDGLYFLPDYVIFSATGVSNEKAIIVSMAIPDTLPELMVSYETVGGVQNFYLSKNMETGFISLLAVE